MARLIDADALITVQIYDDEHEEYHTEKMTVGEYIDRYSDEGCPPTVEPKRGRWIRQATNLLECSVCGKYTHDHDAQYCSHCGARIEGGCDDAGNK